MNNKEIYEAALKPPKSLLFRVIYAIWIVIGLGGLIGIAFAEPWSASLFKVLLAQGFCPILIKFVGVPLVMALRAVLLVESLGYLYHRFLQHVGLFTRLAQVFRKNQRYHWMHHMWIYPIGRFYKRAVAYVASEKGVGWSWVLPGLMAAGLFTLINGVSFGSAFFIFSLWFYAKNVVDLTHRRFHEAKHPWTNSNYFHWLEDIHVLHHWDQRTNFTIVHPLMDMLFGTYLAPSSHRDELKIALEDHELTASDLINWRYLLMEATPAERAAFVANAYKHSRSIRKVDKLLKLLQERVSSHPEDTQARLLSQRAIDLLKELGQNPA